MPSRYPRSQRRPKRLRALVLACALAGVCGLAVPAAVPAPAAAYTEHFCQYASLWPGNNCYAGSRHNLWAVNAWSINSHSRVCAASFIAPWSSQNSDWRCDYGFAQKFLGYRVEGVGGIHNGDGWHLYGYGTQDF